MIHLPHESDTGTRSLERLSSFPSPFPEETVPSIAGRYFLQYGHFTSVHEAVRFLFGTNFPSQNYVLPRGLGRFISLLPEILMLDIHTVLSRHTLFPLVRLFLPPHRADKIGQLLLSGKDSTTLLLGFNSKNRNAMAPPRMCWKCFEDDIRESGTPFWHRAHQIPGVWVCERHKTLLLDGCRICGPFTRAKPLLCMPYLRCECGRDLRDDETRRRRKRGEIEEAVKYASFARRLLEADLPEGFSDHRMDFLRAELERVGLTRGKLFDRGALVSKIINEIPPSLLGDIQLPGSIDESMEARVHKWLHLMLIGNVRARWPAWHIAFLMNIFREFENLKSRWHEFHNANQVQAAKRHAIPVSQPALFPPTLLARLMKPGKDIQHLVSEMPEVFQRIWNSGCIPISSRYLGPTRRIKPPAGSPLSGQDASEVTRDILDYDKGVDTGVSNLFTNLDPRVQQRLVRLRQRVEMYRATLITAISEDPQISYKALYRQHGQGCHYLRLLEPDWFAKHLRPLQAPASRRRPPVDFEKRDEEAQKAIAMEAQRLFTAGGRPRRLTTVRLLRATGLDNMFKNFRKRFPGTRILLSKITETKQQYRRRLLTWAVSELKKQGEPITAKGLTRLTRVWCNLTDIADEVQ